MTVTNFPFDFTEDQVKISFLILFSFMFFSLFFSLNHVVSLLFFQCVATTQ